MLDITQFGGRGDKQTNNTPALDAAIQHITGNRNDYTIYFPAGKYLFKTRPENFPLGIRLAGNGPVGASELGTLLIADYDEPDPEEAFLLWDGKVAFQGTGGGLQDITIMKAYGRMGGTAVKLLGTDGAHRAGWWEGRNLMISGISYDKPAKGAWDRCLLVDGTAANDAGAMGIRDISLYWWNFSKARIATAELRGATHFFASNGQIYEGGISGARFLVTGRGGVNEQSIDIHFANCSFWGELIFDYVNTFTVTGSMASTLNIRANAANGLVQILTHDLQNSGTNVLVIPVII